MNNKQNSTRAVYKERIVSCCSNAAECLRIGAEIACGELLLAWRVAITSSSNGRSRNQSKIRLQLQYCIWFFYYSINCSTVRWSWTLLLQTVLYSRVPSFLHVLSLVSHSGVIIWISWGPSKSKVLVLASPFLSVSRDTRWNDFVDPIFLRSALSALINATTIFHG